MEFDDLLDRLWGFDAEVLIHDSLFVFINYRTREEKVFFNSSSDELYSWIQQENPILMGYNSKGYDKYILQAWLNGYSPEEIKEVNDHIINGGNGWEINIPPIQLPIIWDLMGCIKTFKSLKELEGNLRLNIVESKVDFSVTHKLNKEEAEELIYYCKCDVKALFPIFEMLINNYKSKFIIAKLGGIEPAYALSMTDANLTATLLGGQRKEHKDNFKYSYPPQIDKSKIPQEMLNYIDDLIEVNDLNYKPKAPLIDYGTMEFQVGVGGGHGFVKQQCFEYSNGEVFNCD